MVDPQCRSIEGLQLLCSEQCSLAFGFDVPFDASDDPVQVKADNEVVRSTNVSAW